jgi:mannose-6-phosphate isomerase-like protein (cupin superfamily)
MADIPRRVVTGHDDHGKAIVIEDRPCPNVHTNPERPGYRMSSVWQTGSPLIVRAREPDPTLGPHRLPPPDGGTVIRITEFPPDTMQAVDADKARAIFAAMGGKDTLSPKRQQPHALMHRTKTVDFGLVLEGEIVLVLDDSEVRLHAGDIVVQRGTNHAWSNRSAAPCRMAFILVDAHFDPQLETSIATFDSGGVPG